MSTFTWTTPDRDAQTMDYYELVEIIGRYEGCRVRVTYPNGAQRVGMVGRWRRSPDVLTFDGSPVMGELAGGVRVEVMRANHRYEQVTEPCPSCDRPRVLIVGSACAHCGHVEPETDES